VIGTALNATKHHVLIIQVPNAGNFDVYKNYSIKQRVTSAGILYE
jgi:hypothetical protein